MCTDASARARALANGRTPTELSCAVPIDAYPADRVAKSMLSYAENGYYHLLSPDLLQASALRGNTNRGRVAVRARARRRACRRAAMQGPALHGL
eukprot:1373019-Pleurochrysis_carterae.AAC.3